MRQNLFKKNWLRTLTCIVLFCTIMMVSLLAGGAGASTNGTSVTAQIRPDLTILVDGVSRTFYNVQGEEVHPILYNGTTYLPLRAIGELIGKNVNWDQSTYTVTLNGTRSTNGVVGTPDTTAQRRDVSVQLRSDFTIIVDNSIRTFRDVNGTTVYPLLFDGSTYLPVRSIGELMGKTVSWDGATNTVSLVTSSSENLVTDADSFNQNGTCIGVDKAKELALIHAGLSASQVTFVESKLEYDDGRQVYDIEFYTGDYKEYDYEIDAVSGTVLSFDYDAENYTPPTNGNAIGSVIGEAEAKSIALVQISGASEKNVVRVKLDKDDGLWEYEVKVIYNEVEYEIEINAYTGDILSMDAESIYD